MSRLNAIRRKILRFYKLHQRLLPWRQTTDPYKITVAEIMLQQTQVERVIPKYQAWIKKWPNWKKLATATNRQLLEMWSGLGHNRRALNLGRLAQTIVIQCYSQLPKTTVELEKFPGIGPYTSRAILIFAFNCPLITIDTNIRRVILYELGLPASTSIKKIEQLAWRLLPKKRSRDWHNALMDYSRLALPNQIKRIPALSKQSKFEGSLRQIRGEIIRQLTTKRSVTIKNIAQNLRCAQNDVSKATKALEKESIVKIKENQIRLA